MFFLISMVKIMFGGLRYFECQEEINPASFLVFFVKKELILTDAAQFR
jgi:hypothetical protein